MLYIIKPGIVSAISLLLLIIPSGCRNDHTEEYSVLDGKYWRDQAVNDILPYWSVYSMDKDSGAFITNLGAGWNPGSDSHKYPSMIGRHIFSYSAAYLMTGNEEYLGIAKKTRDFLLEHAWDDEYGGWYNVLQRDGTPSVTSKNIFIQTYALTGLAMYYFVTRDCEVLRYIEKTDSLLEAGLLDMANGGYYNMARQDWQVIDSNKSFASQVAPVSGYLLYMYLATNDPAYFSRSQRIMDCVSYRMKDPESGWILEYFDKDWNIIDSDPDIINVGHNLEVAWMLLRLAMLNNTGKMSGDALKLDDSLFIKAYLNDSGFWHTTLGRNNAGMTGDFTYWWVQAYGNMYSLYSYRVSGRPERIDQFRKGAEFWDRCFLDRENGDTYTSVLVSGDAKDSTKANPYKTSYHSIEHCLLNYLYLNLWVNNEPVRLYFHIAQPHEGDLLFPVPVEDMNIVVENAKYEGSSGRGRLTCNERSVSLPDEETARVMVTIKNKSFNDRQGKILIKNFTQTEEQIK